MTIGLIGLGKMGFNLAQNFQKNGHKVTAFDVVKETLEALKSETECDGVDSIAALCQNLHGRRTIWLMVPSGHIVDETIEELLKYLSPNDIVIDGGNSYYKDSIRRYNLLKAKGIGFLDCGTSGGTSGALNGACTMVGGDRDTYTYLEPVFKSISIENGALYTGDAGSGHYVKMVHNGIEYGMMQSIAEGFELFEKSEFDLNYQRIAQVFNHGSVIRGWLMELTENAFSKDANLEAIKGVMHSSGEGKWAVETALELGVSTPIMAMSLFSRFRSLQTDTFSGKIVAALRNEFGGHAVEKSIH